VKKRRVVFVGDAETRIQEDYLRILRYFRFCARISPDPLVHEREAEEAICKNVDGLQIISGERIWMELKQILSSRHAFPLMEVMLKWGLAPYIGLPQKDSNELLNTPEFREVWQRTENQHLEAISLLATLLQTEDDVIIAIYNYFSIKEHICNLLLNFTSRR
jgi:tRNA nucleotidyltransferase (CCA-adding enzyme)